MGAKLVVSKKLRRRCGGSIAAEGSDLSLLDGTYSASFLAVLLITCSLTLVLVFSVLIHKQAISVQEKEQNIAMASVLTLEAIRSFGQLAIGLGRSTGTHCKPQNNWSKPIQQVQREPWVNIRGSVKNSKTPK